MKYFIGYEVPGYIKQMLCGYQEHCVAERLMPKEQMHITACYIGQDTLDNAKRIFGSPDLSYDPIEVSFLNLMLFGKSLVVRLSDPTCQLANIHTDLVRAVAKPVANTWTYKPHITIASGTSAFNDFIDDAKFSVESLFLYEKQEGQDYNVISARYFQCNTKKSITSPARDF